MSVQFSPLRILTFILLSVSTVAGHTDSKNNTFQDNRYIYAINDNSPAQITRVNIDSPTPVIELMADQIIYSGPTGFGVPIGFNIDETEAAALDPITTTAYIISNMGAESALLTVDLETGLATGIGFLGVEDVNAIAFDPSEGQLYGISSKQAQLYKINRLTGAATALPNIVTGMSSNIEGLAFDHFQIPPVLYAIDEDNGNVYTIDTQDGTGTLVGQTSPTFESIEFDADGTMYAVSNISRLFTLNRITFEATLFADGLIIDGEGLLLLDGETTPDNPIPVELQSFSVQREDAGVKIAWATGSETENLGFHIFRKSESETEFTRLTEKIIAGAGNASYSSQYSYNDNTVSKDESYSYKLADIDFNGRMAFHKTAGVEAVEIISEFSLAQNYPNPFWKGSLEFGSGNSQTTIPFILQNDERVSLRIYNVYGQVVKTLLNEQREAGPQQVSWDGTTSNGALAPSGIYYYQLVTTSHSASRSMVLIK